MLLASSTPTCVVNKRTRRVFVAFLTTLALAACSPVAPTPSRTPSLTTPSPSGPDLRQPGAATLAVDQLATAAGTTRAIRVTIDQSTASMTYIKDSAAVTLGWNNGAIAPLDSDVSYVGQTSFYISQFNLDNVGRMFSQAATLADSNTAQELQINEYNSGRVLMTVTTSPESQTIFFRADGSLINWLVFTTSSGVTEALRDVAGDGVDVIAIGLNDQGFYADVRISQQIIERRTRPAKLPAYTAQRTASVTDQAFSPQEINPAVVANLLMTMPGTLDKPDTPARLLIDMRNDLGVPVIHITVGLTTKDFSLDGTDITNELS
ncbi:MAG: hypothetical protein FWD80_00385 [Propionibacteriaceae bacterium]|nr:hypothetical protein [Propionibacteriaceae bacterium]